MGPLDSSRPGRVPSQTQVCSGWDVRPQPRDVAHLPIPPSPEPPSAPGASLGTRGPAASSVLAPGGAVGRLRWEIPHEGGMCLLLTSCTVCFQPQAPQTATITPNPPDMQTPRYQNHASCT